MICFELISSKDIERKFKHQHTQVIKTDGYIVAETTQKEYKEKQSKRAEKQYIYILRALGKDRFIQ